ncbi:MAG: hypothetical protein ACTHLE_03240 [Agriterribacter sp.]
MKNIIFSTLVLAIITFFACRKTESSDFEKITNPFIKSALIYLQKSLSENDFEKLDLTVAEKVSVNELLSVITLPCKDKSKDYVIVGELNGTFYGNWVSLSNFDHTEGKQQGIIRTKNFDNDESKEVTFVENKAVKILEVNGNKTRIKYIKYDSEGQIIKVNTTKQGVSLKEIDADGYTWLPTVTVTAYVKNNTQSFYSLYWAFNQNPAYINSYSTTPLTGINSGGGGSTGQVVQVPPMQIISGSAIDLAKYLKCFDNVSNTGATYSITIYADIPVNSDAGTIAIGGQPGHTFITLTKTNGSTTVSQTFGFYPQQGYKSIFDSPTSSKMNDNKGHEYNASLTMPNISEASFNAAKNTALTKAASQYDLNDYNCTDYALDVINAARTNKLVVTDWLVEGPAGSPPYYYPSITFNYGTVPNGLYKLLNQMKINAIEYENIKIGTFSDALSKGACN